MPRRSAINAARCIERQGATSARRLTRSDDRDLLLDTAECCFYSLQKLALWTRCVPSLNGHVGDQLPACQIILDVTGDLFTHGRQLKQLVFNDRIIGLLGKLQILGRFRDGDRTVKTARVR